MLKLTYFKTYVLSMSTLNGHNDTVHLSYLFSQLEFTVEGSIIY